MPTRSRARNRKNLIWLRDSHPSCRKLRLERHFNSRLAWWRRNFRYWKLPLLWEQNQTARLHLEQGSGRELASLPLGCFVSPVLLSVILSRASLTALWEQSKLCHELNTKWRGSHAQFAFGNFTLEEIFDWLAAKSTKDETFHKVSSFRKNFWVIQSNFRS